nr:copia protein [Tanacetum cinerariifolium]
MPRGMGQRHMGRSGCSFWYCSGGLECTGDRVGTGGCFGGKSLEEIQLRIWNPPLRKVRRIHIDCAYNLKFSCMIGFEYVHANFLPIFPINVMSKKSYNSVVKDKIKFNGRNELGNFINAPVLIGNFYVVTDFTVVEDMDPYLDEEIGDVIGGEPFCKASCVEAKCFDGINTISDFDDSVTYKMVRSNLRFKHLTNVNYNKILPLLKVSEQEMMNGISHSYQKLKGFYKGVLNLGAKFIRDAKVEEWLIRGHISYSQNSKAYIILNKHTRKINESLNVTFDETPPPSKTSPLVDDDLDEEEAIRTTEKKNIEMLNLLPKRNKLDENGVVSRNKARLVAQGYTQQYDIDYDEAYTPVARLESVRILLAYACALDFKLFHMDVKSAFLNGFINLEVYVAQPLGFIDFKKSDHVYKLKKALYGLKQAPKAWSLDELAYGVPLDGPYQTNPPSPDDIILTIQIDQEGQSKTLERIMAREEVVIPLPPPPSINHLHLISTMMMMI